MATPAFHTRLQLLAMFAGPLEQDSLPVINATAGILGRGGFMLDVFPHPNRPVTTGYKALHDMTGSIEWWVDGHFERIRGWAVHAFRDQVAQRLPVVFCRIAARTDRANPGVTRDFASAPQSLILLDPKRTADELPAALAHEIGHAAGLCPDDPKDPDAGHDKRPYNLMFPGTENSKAVKRAAGEQLDRTQIDVIRRAWFARPV
jgi:hypothetical protein